MVKETTTISLRIPGILNENLTRVSDELKCKKIDFIRFLPEAGICPDEEKLKMHLQKVYENNLEKGIGFLIEKLYTED